MVNGFYLDVFSAGLEAKAAHLIGEGVFSDNGEMWSSSMNGSDPPSKCTCLVLAVLAARERGDEAAEDKFVAMLIDELRPISEGIGSKYEHQEVAEREVSQNGHGLGKSPGICWALGVVETHLLEWLASDRVLNYHADEGLFEGYFATMAENVLKSEARKQRARGKHEAVQQDDEEEFGDGIGDGIFADARPKNPELLILEGEEEQDAKEKVARLLQFVSGKSKLEELLKAKLEDSKATKGEIAVMLKTTELDINNRWRCLCRRARKLFK